MKSKDKNRGNIIILTIIIVWASLIAICYLWSNKQIAYASNSEASSDNIKISNAQKINIEDYISKNIQKATREEIVTEEVELEYITKYRNSSELVKGKTRVAQEGRNGTQKIIKKIIYDEQGNSVGEEQVGATVVKSSINKIIEIGTAEPKQVAVAKSTTTTSASSSLSFDMPLNKPSGFSQEQFKTALTDSKDVNKIFSNNAEYFCLIEEQYNINGMFVAAIGIHESSWGTSKLALNKFNLFGYGAYDSNPYNGAYSFTNYSDCIDLIARVLVKYYINPAGTPIYDGQTASGKYYSGNTLSAVNKKYASDSNWANAVYKYMQYLYSKI